MLKYEFVDSNLNTYEIQINLIDSPLNVRWQTYLLATYQRIPKIDWLIGRTNKPWVNDFNERLNVHLFRIYKAFLYFQTHLPYNFDEEIKLIEYFVLNPNSLGQIHLNKWHRYFTTLAEMYLQENIKIPPSCNRDELYRNIHELNGHVHHLERFTFGKNQKRVNFGFDGQYSIHAPNIHNMSNLFNTIWAPGHVEYLEPGHYDYATNDYNYDVWIHEDIQGKDLIRAWLDDDDLSQDDITGNKVMTPNVLLDPTNIYKRVLDNSDFRKQVSKSGKTLDRIPLGNIVEPGKIDFEIILSCKVSQITLNDIPLWTL